MKINAIIFCLTASLCLTGFMGSPALASEKKAFQTEMLLVRSGFTYKYADTPKKLEEAKKLPPMKLVRRVGPDTTTYLFANLENCKCVYFGDEEAYQRFRENVRAERRSDRIAVGVVPAANDLDMAELIGAAEGKIPE